MVWIIFLLCILFVISDSYRISTNRQNSGFRLPFRLLAGVIIFAICYAFGYESVPFAITGIVITVIICLIVHIVTAYKKKIQKRIENDPEFRAQYEQKIADEKAREELIQSYRHADIKYCPYCLSTDFQYAGYEMKGRKEVTKSHSWAVPVFSPLYYVTGSEHTKVKRRGRRVNEYVCLKCGRIFN